MCSPEYLHYEQKYNENLLSSFSILIISYVRRKGWLTKSTKKENNTNNLDKPKHII